jgi:hypothetical protein
VLAPDPGPGDKSDRLRRVGQALISLARTRARGANCQESGRVEALKRLARYRSREGLSIRGMARLLSFSDRTVRDSQLLQWKGCRALIGRGVRTRQVRLKSWTR